MTKKQKRILTVAVHPDDETLGCGATLLKHKYEGDEIYWLIITNISEKHGYNPDHVRKRQNQIGRVGKLYDFDKVYKLDFPTTGLDQIPMVELVTRISIVISEIKPEIIYVPFHSDVHTDHQITFKAMMSCTKNFKHPFIKKIMMCETLSETEFAPPFQGSTFIPNIFIDSTEFHQKRLEIMKIYDDEIMELPLPRSMETIENLARYRGSRIGVKYAEAFMLIEEIL